MSSSEVLIPELKPRRGERGRFGPGNNANPRGRPRGVRSQVTLELHQKLNDAQAEILDQIISDARHGEQYALKLLGGFYLGKAASRMTPVYSGDLNSPADIREATRSVATAAMRGQIAPADAIALQQTIAGVARAGEFVSLIDAVRQLQAMVGHPPVSGGGTDGGRF